MGHPTLLKRGLCGNHICIILSLKQILRQQHFLEILKSLYPPQPRLFLAKKTTKALYHLKKNLSLSMYGIDHQPVY